jgi:hypothetical protein
VRQSPIDWRSAELEDETHVLLFYDSGQEPCNVLGTPDVEYGPDTVTITLNEGSAPTEGDLTCTSVSIRKVVRIELDEPVADRTVVDGFSDTSP